jgi:hypothetical protein
MHDTNHLLAYDDDDDVNQLGDNIDIMKKNTETLIGVRFKKEVGLDVS